MVLRSVLVTTLFLAFGSAAQAATSKEDACALQGDMVAQIQQARLDRVGQAKVGPNLMAANPDWPASVETAMPPLVNWIYAQKRRDLRKTDLGPTVEAQCLENWDQLQSLAGSSSN